MRAQVVIVGGGIVGCSVAYHLAELGVTDVIVLEQGELSCGTTWHAAGLVGQLRSTESMTRLIRYSTELYDRLEAETGLGTGWMQCGSVTVARTAERMTQLRRMAAVARSFGVECELLTPAEAGRMWPVMDVSDLAGGVWLPGDGKANPTDLTQALARGARQKGVKIRERVKVTGIAVRDGRVTGVHTVPGGGLSLGEGGGEEQGGLIECETVVNCAGQWAKAIGRMAGVTVPLHSAEHYYIVTEQIDGVHPDLPVLRDPDGYTYFKEEVGGLAVGGFEPDAKPWGMDGIPEPFEFQLLPEDWDQFAILMENALQRVPALDTTGVKMFYNGPESFTPDNHFLLGEAPEVRGFYVGAGFNSMGIASAGGAGRALAEWVAAGAPQSDLWPVDIRRFARWSGNDAWLHDRVKEVLGLHYAMPWPDRELSTARPLRRSPVHHLLAQAGAVFGSKMGWERVNYFGGSRGVAPPESTGGGSRGVAPPESTGGGSRGVAPPESTGGGSRGVAPPESTGGGSRGVAPPESTGGAPAEPTFDRPGYHAAVAAEVRATRERAALFDQTSFSKFTLKGPDAAAVLRELCTADVDVPPGRVVYTGMLNDRGGYEADLTVTRVAADEYLIVSSSGTTTRDFDHISKGLHGNAQLVDVSGGYAVFGLMGPDGAELLSRCTRSDLNFEFGDSRLIDLGYATVRATRITYVGEHGWELYVPAEFGVTVYETLLNTGVAQAGYYAIESMRLEKGYRAWGRDLGPEITPGTAGLTFACKRTAGYRGRAVVDEERESGVRRRLVSFTMDDPDVQLWGGELVLRDGVPAGYLTSAAYGHTLGRAVAIGLVENEKIITRDWITAGKYEVDVAGVRHAATVHTRAPL